MKNSISLYRIMQNFGGGKLWQIWQNERHLPIFYPAKFQFTKIADVSYCKFANIFLAKVLPCHNFALYGIDYEDAICTCRSSFKLQLASYTCDSHMYN